MGITQSRIDTKNKKKRRFGRRVIALFILVSLLLVGLSYVILEKWIQTFNATKVWDKTAISGQYATLPAEFVKNEISADMIEDVNSLSKVGDLITRAQQDSGLTARNIDDARKQLAKSEKILAKYNLETGEAKRNHELLQTYIEAYDVLEKAYTDIDVTKLSEVITKMNDRVLASKNDGDAAILKKLNKISDDYVLLNTFVETYVPYFANVSDGVATLNLELTSSVSDEMKAYIADNNLTKFKNIEDLYSKIDSLEWEKAVKANNAHYEKAQWETIKSVFYSLSKSQYIKVSEIKTLEDAKKLGIKVSGADERYGYLILDKSPVTQVQLGETVLKSSQYVRRDADITAYVKASYKSDPDFEESTTSSTSSSSTSSSSSSSTVGNNSTSEANTSDSSSQSQTIAGLSDDEKDPTRNVTDD